MEKIRVTYKNQEHNMNTTFLFDFSNKEQCSNYVDLSVKYKDMVKRLESVKAEDCIVSIGIYDKEYKLISNRFLPNVEHMKTMASFDEDKIIVFDSLYIGENKIPTLEEFENLVGLTVGVIDKQLGNLEDNYRVKINVFDSYSESHVEALRKIVELIYAGHTIKTITEDNKKKWVIESTDREARKLIMDLSVSDYCEAEFIEISN